MIDRSNMFPDTPEGIKKAVERAGTGGFWEQYVDWYGGNKGDISRRGIIAEAVREGADVSPDLIAEAGIAPSPNVKTVVDIGGVTLGGMVNEGGGYDVMPPIGRPSDFRKSLPA